MQKKAIIIGAGPAGLTAAYELLTRTGIVPIILEKSGEIGGISRTTNYKGNRMDMGPHRFFSKSDRVMNWWLKMMPLEENAAEDIKISYQNKTRNIPAEQAPNAQAAANPHAPKDPDKVMLVIQRLTRIYFLRKFFAYPIQLGFDTLRTLGLIRTIRILVSFLRIRIFPRTPETNLEDFIINKFGKELYLLFFKDYTEKVWGKAPSEISAEWGAQRIKGVSLSKAIGQALKSLRAKKKGGDINQKGTETSLIEQFLYPKYGPGSLWEEVARQVQAMGGKIYLHQDVKKIHLLEGKIHSVDTINSVTDQPGSWEGEYFFSTMPVQELIAGMGDEVPEKVREVAAGLQYRDFINVGILLKQLSAAGKTEGEYTRLELKDNWIYIQERDVKVGRLMIYNNWGGGMIKDPNTTWIGMEYFCNKTDDFWAKSDEAIQQVAIKELEQMGLARVEDVLDSTVRRMEKTYPAYFGTYNEFNQVKAYADGFENLFLVGRNGMHKYNNADHSMLTAMVAVDNIAAGVTAKANLWAINTEQEYHEEKKGEPQAQAEKQTVRNPEPSSVSESQPARELTPSFAHFVFREPRNRRFLLTGVIAILVQFIIFKFLYPFPDFFSDSYSYIESAATHASVNIWPIGYSRFLAAFHVLTHSDTALIFFQYFLLEFAAFWFFFTVEHLYHPTKNNSLILYIFLFFNPLFLYISNYVSSDSLFTSLSLLWLVQLLWILAKPKPYRVITHAILITIAFTVRYNAIYYPLISVLAFLLSRQQIRYKIVGIGLPFLLIFLFINFTREKTYKITGEKQFSVFSGWQLANNILYVYPHINVDSSVFSNPEIRYFNRTVQRYFDTIPVRAKEISPIDGAFYIQYSKAPLKAYYFLNIKTKKPHTQFEAWANVSSVFSKFGSTLITENPVPFIKYYILPNTRNYFLPPLEKLEIYNLGSNAIRPNAKNWFHYESTKVKSISNTAQGEILLFFPALFLFLNLISIVSLFYAFTKHVRHRLNTFIHVKMLILMASLLFINASFSILASPIVMRYQLFPAIACLFFFLNIVEVIEKNEHNKPFVRTAHPAFT